MYEYFALLLKSRGVTAYEVSKNTGIPQSTLSDWKRGRCTPKQDKLQKIADFFGVSIDYLVNGKEAKHYSVSDEEKDYLEELRNRREMRMLFKSAHNASKEQLEAVAKTLDLMKGNADGEQ